MKKLIITVAILLSALTSCTSTKYTYHENGIVEQQGSIENEMLNGKWKKYDRNGKLETVGYYKDNKKDSVWLFINQNRKVVYSNNEIISVSTID